jgi:methionyl-tRNA formyltransferase
MTVLILGQSPSRLTSVIRNSGCRALERTGHIDTNYLIQHAVDFIVSYRYRHIIKRPIIELMGGNIVNLHISMLPWNRGADPNLWSFLEDTPKGVTIHYVDEGLDTGDIVFQKEVVFDQEIETLASTYKKLNDEIISIFEDQWPLIIAGKIKGRVQASGGSFHKLSDKRAYEHLLKDKGWKTPVKNLIGKAKNL